MLRTAPANLSPAAARNYARPMSLLRSLANRPHRCQSEFATPRCPSLHHTSVRKLTHGRTREASASHPRLGRSRDRRQICRGFQDLRRQSAALQLRAMNIIYETTKERGATNPDPDIDARQLEFSRGVVSGRSSDANAECRRATIKWRQWRGGPNPIAISSASSSSPRRDGSRPSVG